MFGRDGSGVFTRLLKANLEVRVNARLSREVVFNGVLWFNGRKSITDAIMSLRFCKVRRRCIMSFWTFVEVYDRMPRKEL